MRQGKRWIVLLGIIYLGCGEPKPLHAQNPGSGGEWYLPDNRFGVRTAPLLLLSRPDVQVDLRLRAFPDPGNAEHDQRAHASRAYPARQDSAAAVVAERRAIDQAQLEWLSNNLTGNQLERLRQIELQWEGVPAMLSRPMVAGYLKLTSEQEQTLARIITERNRLRADGAVNAAD